MKDSAAAADVLVRFCRSQTHFVKENDDWIFKLISLSHPHVFYNLSKGNMIKEVITY